ncbi:hypothetical protein LCGC14_1042490 [marine sediment metagenome]|uniref:Carbon storage regulator n=1 Tax=marine sediment metagenome TaxID=412755 RepID=A0A0F9Q9L9_9ZZZZ
MLVLSCAAGERIVIGEEATIWITLLTGGRVGVDAPREIPVHREAVYHDIRRNGERRTRV